MQNEQTERTVLTNGEIYLPLMPDNEFDLFIEYILSLCENDDTD